MKYMTVIDGVECEVEVLTATEAAEAEAREAERWASLYTARTRPLAEALATLDDRWFCPECKAAAPVSDGSKGLCWMHAYTPYGAWLDRFDPAWCEHCAWSER